MALRNEVVIEGKLVRYEMKVVKDFSIGTGSIARSFGKNKPMAFFDFEIWNPNNDLDEMLQNAASEENKPFVRLTGSLRQDVWEKNGVTNRKIKITATDVVGIEPDFTPANNDNSNQQSERPAPSRPQVNKKPQYTGNKPFVKPQQKTVSAKNEQDIPF